MGQIKAQTLLLEWQQGNRCRESCLTVYGYEFKLSKYYGGEQTDITLGLNWYLNSATRIMLNEVWTHFKDQGSPNIFEVRFQIDF